MNKIALLILSIIFSGCLTKQNLIRKNPYKNTTKISGTIKEIMITDLRQNISDRNIKIPAITSPGMKDEVSPTLQDVTKVLIKEELAKQFSGKSDTTYTAVIKIKKALIGFRADALSEKQYADVEIEILTTDQFGTIKNYVSNVYLENKSLDASPKYTNMLFERGLINSVHKCFNTTAKR